jgi:long-chain acyl-CoA synthetase
VKLHNENNKSSTIIEKFLKVTGEYPDNIAFHYPDPGDTWRTLTYAEFLRGVQATAASLISIGLQRGERVAIISENRWEWCSAYLSIIRAGGIAVPVDAQLGPEEITNLMRDSESKMIFHSQKTSENVVACSKKLLAGREKPLTALNFDSQDYEFLLQTKLREKFPEISCEDTASIIYTSGTTGNPKGVVLTQANFCCDADALIEAGVVSHEDNVLSVLPLHHTYAFMCTFLVPVFLGASITYPVSLKGPDLISAIRERGVSVLIGVPQLLAIIRNGIRDKIMDLPLPLSSVLWKLHKISGLLRATLKINLGRLIFRSVHLPFGEKFRFFGSGGAKLDPLVMKDLEAFGFTVLEGYGLTETSPVVTFNPISKRKPGSAGKPLPSVEMKVLNPSEAGEGEIAVKGPVVMKGYYKNPSATAEVMQEGWFKTGDIGSIDNDGYLFVSGRSKEVIVLSSGKNIYPEDVEKIYLQSKLIKEICVLGIERDGLSESLHAVIVPDLEYAKQTQVPNIQDAIKWEVNDLSSRLPSFMRLSGFTITTGALPRTRLGKLRRFMIKDELAHKIERREDKSEQGIDSFIDEAGRKVRDALKEFIKEGQKINQDDNLELDLGLDSLSKIELVVALEKIFSLNLPENFLLDIQTVAELTEKIKKLTPGDFSGKTSAKREWKNILFAEPSARDLKDVSLEKPGSRMIPSFLIHTLLRALFKMVFRLETKGIEHIPKDGNFILTPNHTSYLDGFAVILSLPFTNFRNLYSLGLREFFTGFLKSRLARMAHVIPIDSSVYLNKALQMSAYVLKNRRSLSVFPEGGRSFDGKLMEFKKGVGILAIEMGVPVTPVYIEGTLEALPRGAKIPKCKKITVIFGSPFYATDINFSKNPEGVDKYQHFVNILRERVKGLKPVLR